MPKPLYLKLTDKLACQASPTTYGVLHTQDLVDAQDVHAIEDQESLTFKYPRLDRLGVVRPITAQLRQGRVCTVVWDDGSFDEWRVGIVDDGRGQGGLITVACVPLWLDLTERADSSTGKGWVSSLSNGNRVFEFQISQSTASQIWTTYVMPACPSWVTAGTIDSTAVIPTLALSRQTPWAVALAVRDALRSMDVTCEVALRRNGTTDYKLDLVTQVGSAQATPVFHPVNALASLKRRTDPTLQATRILVKGANAPDTLPGVLGRSRWKCTAIDGVNKTLTLADRNGGSGPIGFDNQWVNAYVLRVKTGRTYLISASSASAQAVTVPDVANIATDEDFEFRLTEPLSNTRQAQVVRYAITAVTPTTITNSGNPIAADGQYLDWYARAWTAASGGSIVKSMRVSGTVASTDVSTVDDTTGVTTSHFIEFIQLDGAGEIPAYVDHPVYAAADPTGYGIKAKELAKSRFVGAVQLMPNAWMRTWSNPANPPDGYAKGGTATTSKNTDSAFTQYGGGSYKILTPNLLCTVTSPPFYFPWNPGQTRLSVIARLYVASLSQNAGNDPPIITVGVYPLTATGTLSAAIASATAYGANATTTNQLKITPGTFASIAIQGIPLAATAGPYGFAVQVTFDSGLNQPNGANPYEVYLDAIEAYPFVALPTDAFEFGDATALLQAGNNDLRTYASPPLFYEVGVRDLERAFPADYPRLKLGLGGNVRAADVEYGIDTTVRLLRMERDLLHPLNTRLTLANRPRLMTDLVQTGAGATGPVQVPAGPVIAGTLALASGASTSLPADAELAIAAASGSVTLPAGSSSTGAAITVAPSNPATTPSITVLTGTPPSKRKVTVSRGRDVW